jgi:hypothetical protein
LLVVFVNVHCWQALPSDVHCWIAVPFAVEQFLASRTLPLAVLVSRYEVPAAGNVTVPPGHPRGPSAWSRACPAYPDRVCRRC